MPANATKYLIFVCAVLVCFAGCLLPVNSVSGVESANITATAKTPHTPIHITGNNNFTSENGVISGNGTPENPYLIANWEIDGANTEGYGIYIEFTTACCVISECKITNVSTGIFLHVTSNITIQNTTISMCAVGIGSSSTTNTTICSNEISMCEKGIDTDHDMAFDKSLSIIGNRFHHLNETFIASAEIISENSFTDNQIGCWLYGVNNVTRNFFARNQIGCVIWYIVDNFTDNIIVNNTEGIVVHYGGTHIASNEIAWNTNNGINMGNNGGLYTLIENNTIHDNGGSGIFILTKSYIVEQTTDTRCKCYLEELAVHTAESHPITTDVNEEFGICIQNNRIFCNGGAGVHAECNMVGTIEVIKNNLIENNIEGIQITNSPEFESSFFTFLIYNNTIRNNEGYAINISLEPQASLRIYATIHSNFILYNNHGNRQAQELNTRELQDSQIAWNTTTCGNYWSDWDWPDADGDGIVDYPYPIEGNARAFDFKPLTLKNITLVATAGNKCVNLTWYNAFWANYTVAKIYRSTDHVNYTCIAETNNTTYLDTDVVNGVNYSYYVVLMNNTTEVVRSNTVFAMPVDVPSAPQNFTVRGYENKIELHWDAPATSEGSEIVKYRIYRGVHKPENVMFYTEVYACTQNFTDTKVVNNITYFYCVAAVNGAGEGNNTSVLGTMLSNLSVAIKVTPGTLGGGENASVEVKVTRYADGVAVENASVMLSSENISGYFSTLTGYTDANGTFVARFYAGNVERNASGRIFAMVRAYGYSDVIAGTELNVQAEVAETKALSIGIELNSTAVVAGDCVSLDVWVKDAKTGEFVNATIDVNVTNKEIVEVENITPEGTGRWQITMKIPANASGATVVLDITAHAAGYENASAHFAFCVGERGSASADYLPWEIALAVLVFVIAVLGAKLLLGRKRRVKKF